MPLLPIEDITQLVTEIFVAHNTNEETAKRVAQALIDAEIMGQKGHGLSRVSSYAAQARSGKLDGQAQAKITSSFAGLVRVDAAHGFAYPALDLALEALALRAKSQVIACAALYNSHHCGMLSQTVETLAREGLVALMFANTPKAIAPWGGKDAIFGTNPIAFAAPRHDGDPIVIDLALSKVARGKIMAAQKAGETIPEGWALDREGQPTADANAALAGTMVPMADAKGAALALMVEILAASLTGALQSFEASSFFEAEGKPPSVGQLLIAIDPDPVSDGGYGARIQSLVEAITSQNGTRLPGARGQALREEAYQSGKMEISQEQYDELQLLIDT